MMPARAADATARWRRLVPAVDSAGGGKAILEWFAPTAETHRWDRPMPFETPVRPISRNAA
jgi:hypothetical protein